MVRSISRRDINRGFRPDFQPRIAEPLLRAAADRPAAVARQRRCINAQLRAEVVEDRVEYALPILR